MARSLLRRLTCAAPALFGLLGLGVGGCLIDERLYDDRLGDCTAYCDLVSEKCDFEGYRPYQRRETCMAVCDLMASGDGPGQGETDNTLRCRMNILDRNDVERRDCANVGPGGGGECGTDCEALCELRISVCGDAEGTRADCLSRCAALRDNPDISAASPDSDTLQCRLVHISEAAINPSFAEAHCEHTQVEPVPETVVGCVDPQDQPRDEECATYCGLVMAACTGGNQVYEDTAECVAVCHALDQGVRNDTVGNTLRCRRYHSYSAFTIPDEHCTHAGPTGDGHCGNTAQGEGNCLAFCQIAKAACGPDFDSTYGASNAPDDLGNCHDECRALEDSEANGFKLEPRYVVTPPPQGNTLRCRTYHAVQALEGDPAECASALGLPVLSACQG